MATLKEVIKVTQEQYNTLQQGGTVKGHTGLSEDNIYLVEDNSALVIYRHILTLSNGDYMIITTPRQDKILSLDTLYNIINNYPFLPGRPGTYFQMCFKSTYRDKIILSFIIHPSYRSSNGCWAIYNDVAITNVTAPSTLFNPVIVNLTGVTISNDEVSTFNFNPQ